MSMPSDLALPFLGIHFKDIIGQMHKCMFMAFIPILLIAGEKEKKEELYESLSGD